MTRMVGGFEVGRYTPETVLRSNGLAARASIDQLVQAAAAHDATNPGYLSTTELQRGADDLLRSLAGAPTTTTSDRFEYSRAVLDSVKTSYLTSNPNRTFSDAEVIGAAAQWDDGNGYLKRSELEAGAMELQITSAGTALKASDIAAIRSWTGCQRTPATPAGPPPSAREIGVVSDIDKTLMPPERNGVEPAAYPGVASLLTMLERGAQGNGALGDVTYVTARNPGRVTTIAAWLATNGLPAGTVETGTVAFPLNVAEDNKVADIAAVLRANPGQEFVMFGDTNHRDPEVYARIRAAFPSQVKAVIIHDVKTIDASRLVGHKLVANYAQAAAHLFSLRVIGEAGARSVMVAARAEGLVISDAEIDALITAHRP
ncbi:MAG: hypothetical protein A2138_11370 [Deltaproteobacteria bacterium RBG_16_71_12]|nr:MAG: hypothetical protein A2138_11370 [Deltaproteobacteria bacterium RBG_16_71_12]